MIARLQGQAGGSPPALCKREGAAHGMPVANACEASWRERSLTGREAWHRYDLHRHCLTLLYCVFCLLVHSWVPTSFVGPLLQCSSRFPLFVDCVLV